jgi:hypothetical protein
MKFETFLEIEIGEREMTPEDALWDARVVISPYARQIVNGTEWWKDQKRVVRFTRTKVQDLGYPEGCYIDELNRKVTHRIGHSLCARTDGPEIRLALQDQCEGDKFCLAMNPVEISYGDICIFQVRRENHHLILDTYSSYFGGLHLNPDDEVVFRLGR